MFFAITDAIGVVEQGGAIVWVQVALGLMGAIFVLDRLIFFHLTRLNVADLLVGLGNHVKKNSYAEARHEASRAPGPVARVAYAVLLRSDLPRCDLRDIAQEAGQLEVPRIERNIRGILNVALLAPLVGLLGTILGIVDVFQKMRERGGQAAPTEISAGIFQALATTALGLMIATIMYLFYLYFMGRAQRLMHRLERTGIETVNMVADARHAEEQSRSDAAKNV
jgi:biopolymer transport protein ExbB